MRRESKQTCLEKRSIRNGIASTDAQSAINNNESINIIIKEYTEKLIKLLSSFSNLDENEQINATRRAKNQNCNDDK